MSIFTKILSGGLDTVVSTAGKVLDNLFTSDDEKQKNKIAMMEITLAAAQAEKQLALETEKAYMEDMKDLRKMITVELQSEDAYVRRNRPTFNYIFYVIIIFNYIFLPAYQLVTGQTLEPIVLPVALWAVFGTGFGLYGYYRSQDKKNALKK